MNKGYKYETQVAYNRKGRKVPLSGAGTLKEDVETDTHLIQCKYTDKESYSIKLKDLKALELNAMKVGKIPEMDVSFSGYEVVIVPKRVWEGLNE